MTIIFKPVWMMFPNSKQGHLSESLLPSRWVLQSVSSGNVNKTRGTMTEWSIYNTAIQLDKVLQQLVVYPSISSVGSLSHYFQESLHSDEKYSSWWACKIWFSKVLSAKKTKKMSMRFAEVQGCHHSLFANESIPTVDGSEILHQLM